MQEQVFTIAKLHYINGVVYSVAVKGSTSLQDIADNSSETTESGNVKHSFVRVRTLAKFAKGLGLLSITKDNKVAITDLGQKYYEGGRKEKRSLSKAQ